MKGFVCLFFIKFSLKFVPKCPIDNNQAVVQIMDSRQIGDEPLSEPKLTRFTDACMRHQGRGPELKMGFQLKLKFEENFLLLLFHSYPSYRTSCSDYLNLPHFDVYCNSLWTGKSKAYQNDIADWYVLDNHLCLYMLYFLCGVFWFML